MTYTDVVINVSTQDYAVFRLFTVFTVDEVDYKRMVQYFIHKDDVEIEFIQDSENVNVKSLRVWDDDRVLLFNLQTDAYAEKSNDSALATFINTSYWDVSGTLVSPHTGITEIYQKLYEWKFNIEI